MSTKLLICLLFRFIQHKAKRNNHKFWKEKNLCTIVPAAVKQWDIIFIFFYTHYTFSSGTVILCMTFFSHDFSVSENKCFHKKKRSINKRIYDWSYFKSFIVYIVMYFIWFMSWNWVRFMPWNYSLVHALSSTIHILIRTHIIF